MKEKKYLFTGIIQKPALLLALLLFSCLLRAQQEEKASDTTLLEEIQADTSAQADPPPLEEDGQKQSGTDYFGPREMPGLSDSLVFRKCGDSVSATLKRDDDFWYANTVFQKEKEDEDETNDTSFMDSGLFQGFLWLCIIGGFITFLIMYLSNSSVGIFRKNKDIAVAESDEETDDIFTIQYQKQIDKAISAGNHRLAVRLMFLKLLRGLSDKNIIQYTKDRTNFDYLLQVQQSPWYHLFFRLTRNYEYIWYGKFDIDQEKFDSIKNEFFHLEQQLQRI